MSTLAEHIKRLKDRREAIQPGENPFLLWDDQQFRTNALLLCTTHLDEIAALAREQEAQITACNFCLDQARQARAERDEAIAQLTAAREQEAQPAPTPYSARRTPQEVLVEAERMRAAQPALDSEGEPMKLCTVCGSPVRYGSRHSQCGAAIEQAIRAAQPAPNTEYSFACYSCAREWQAPQATDDCPACGTTNNFCAENPGAAQPADSRCSDCGREIKDGKVKCPRGRQCAVFWAAQPAAQEPATLTDAQCDEFRRHPGTFNDMVRHIYRAGQGVSQEGGKGNALGFVIDSDILRWDDGGCRPASSEEMAMWEAMAGRKSEAYWHAKYCAEKKERKDWQERAEDAEALAGGKGDGWISVEERFPKAFEEVLIAISTGKAMVASYSVEWGWDWAETDDAEDMEAEVTHWMPLPQPPHAEEGGTNG